MKKFLLALLLAVSLTGIANATQIGGNTVNVNSVTPGTTATKLGKAEDAAAASGDTIVPAASVYLSTPAQNAGTTGDYSVINTNPQGAVYTQNIAGTVGGLSIFRNIDIDESPTGQSAKDSAGVLYAIDVINDTAATKEYLKIYDQTAAGTTVGTTTPTITIPLPAAAVNQHITFNPGLQMSTGMTFVATTGIADNDTGAPAANAVVVNAYYK